jgi:hypothetical protein
VFISRTAQITFFLNLINDVYFVHDVSSLVKRQANEAISKHLFVATSTCLCKGVYLFVLLSLFRLSLWFPFFSCFPSCSPFLLGPPITQTVSCSCSRAYVHVLTAFFVSVPPTFSPWLPNRWQFRITTQKSIMLCSAVRGRISVVNLCVRCCVFSNRLVF